MNSTAIIVLANGFEEIEALTPVDILRRADIQVTMLGLTSLDVHGSHNIIVKADMLFKDFAADFDAIILPGGPGHRRLLESDAVISLIQAADHKHKLCAAICASPSVLGKAGILAHKKVTCFPGFEDKLGGGTFVNLPTVSDGNIITGKSAGVSIDFALAIVAFLAGADMAAGVAKKIIY
jgi:protein deglycase